MRVLGIDPGTAITGYGLVEEVRGDLKLVAFGVIRTPADQPLPRRLQLIYHAVSDLAEEWEPEAAAVEELFFSRNVRTAMSVGQARGVALLALADAGLDVAYLFVPVVHHLFASTDEGTWLDPGYFTYIPSADNYFARSVWIQVGIWLAVAAIALGVHRLRVRISQRREAARRSLQP